MNRYAFGFIEDAAIITLLYLGVVVGNPFATNVLLFITAVALVLKIAIMMALEPVIKSVILKYPDPPNRWFEYTMNFLNFCYAFFLAGYGWWWCASIWMFLAICKIIRDGAERKMRELD